MSLSARERLYLAVRVHGMHALGCVRAVVGIAV